MRRVWIMVLALTMVLFVTGCGKDDGKAVQGEKAKEEKTVAKMPKELSATVITSSGGRAVTSKFFMKDGKIRMEMAAAGGMYTIVRTDMKKVWMVMPPNKSYMETEISNEQQKLPEDKVKGEVSRKEVGKETIDGHPTIKYEVTAKVDEKETKTYQWMATDINFPVKMAAVDGSWSVEYKDIKIGGQADDLFEVPAGYKKTAMPAMPKGMIPGKGAKE